MAQWIARKGPKVEAECKHRRDTRPGGVETSEDSEEENQETPTPKPSQKLQQRNSVSAEAFGAWNKKEDFKPKFVKKSENQIQRITNRLSTVFMFSSLDDKEKDIVIGAMEEVHFNPSDKVISQGKNPKINLLNNNFSQAKTVMSST